MSRDENWVIHCGLYGAGGISRENKMHADVNGEDKDVDGTLFNCGDLYILGLYSSVFWSAHIQCILKIVHS